MRDHRPRFHLTAPAGWLNDPNALVQRDGRYHVFYQHNPAGTVWGDIAWGHAASDDLLRWEHLPVALTPTPGGPDADGCWSGCLVDDDGVPTLVYSGFVAPSPIGARSVCLARGDDDLVTWRKDERNPVLVAPTEGIEPVAFRDPCVWRDGGGWILVLGSGVEPERPVLVQYRSTNLLEWAYDGVVYVGDGARAWECPQLFPAGDRHVLLASLWDDRLEPETQHTIAIVGRYDGSRFRPETTSRFDHGPEFYAPTTALDARGRRLALGWAWEARAPEAAAEQGWAGTLTVPRVLSLREDRTLGIAPADELASLRSTEERVEQMDLRAGRTWSLETRGACIDVELRVETDHATVVELDVCASPDGEERTTIRFHRASGRLEVEREHASLDPRAVGGVHGGRLDLEPGEPLDLRVVVDRSIVEVFANGRFALTERIYPTREDSRGLALSAAGGDAAIEHLAVWTLTP